MFIINKKAVFYVLLSAGLITATALYSGGILKAVTDESQKAANYILIKSQNTWTTMALSAAGKEGISVEHLKNIDSSNANDYSSAILAITALNQDPRTFGGSDYVAKLESFWNGTQLGDSGLLNDDIFGMLALVSAGESLSGSTVEGIKNYIVSEQNSDGGWGWSPDANSDSNMTSAAIMALVSAGVSSSDSIIQSASSFLKTMQNEDGGFRYDTSDFSKNSDTASDSWAISAIYAMGQSPSNWGKGTADPLMHLKSLQDEAGFFHHQQGGQENSFTPTETAYAIIALEGKFFPLKVVTPTQSFLFRIEGKDKTICQGSVQGPTALDIVKNAAVVCEFNYNIEETQYGPYLKAIAGEEALGLIGWLYLVNFMPPSVGAADYNLEQGDEVLWYFGDFAWQPSKLEINNDGTTALLHAIFYSGSEWQDLPGATVYVGSSSFVTDSSGMASISIASLEDGLYQTFVEKQGYIRSNKVTITVGQPPEDRQVGLKVNILKTKPLDDQDSIFLSVSPSNIDFGDMEAGDSKSKILNLSNNGSGNINVTSEVGGAEVFRSNIVIDGKLWNDFSANLPKNSSLDAQLKLSVPNNYLGEFGEQEGGLTFWATAQ